MLHKAVGIILLAVVLKRTNLTWSDIGFQRNGFVSGILKGLLLGSACFAVSYGVELAILRPGVKSCVSEIRQSQEEVR